MPCWWIRQTGLEQLSRSVESLAAWAELLELCDREYRAVAVRPDMQAAILDVERELSLLYKIEDCAIRLARIFKRMRDSASAETMEFDDAMTDLWEQESKINGIIEMVLPEAFTPEAMKSEEPMT